MKRRVPFLSHLEGIREFIVRHAGFAPGGFPELHSILFGGFVILVSSVLGLGFKVKIRRIVQNLL